MRSGRHRSQKRAQSAPSRRLPLTVGSAGLGSTSRDLSLQLPTGPCLVVRRTISFFFVVVAAPLAAVTFALTPPPPRVRGERFSGVVSGVTGSVIGGLAGGVFGGGGDDGGGRGGGRGGRGGGGRGDVGVRGGGVYTVHDRCFYEWRRLSLRSQPEGNE